MLKNFFKTAFRQFFKNRGYTTIHLVGLTLGIATSLVILLLVQYEWTFDKHWDEGEKIFRVSSKFSGVFESVNRGVPGPVPKAIKADLPQFSHVVPLYTTSGMVSREPGAEDRFIKEDLALVSVAFFKVFSNWEWIAGDGKCLEEPHRIILSEEAASRYFVEDKLADLIGQRIYYDDTLSLIIGGILKKPKHNTDFVFDGYISYPTIEASWLRDEINLTNWGSTTSASLVYVKTAPGVDRSAAQAALDRLEEARNQEDPEQDWRTDFVLQPIEEIHFDTEYGLFNSVENPVDKSTILGIGLIGVFLLFMACFNFINLETAKASLRSKEIGVRKALGSSRSALIIQFLAEAFLLAVIAAVLAIPTIQVIFPLLGDYLPSRFTIEWMAPQTLLALLCIVLLVTLFSGLYPASVITSANVADSFKSQGGGSRSGKGALWMRRGLIGTQFFITQLLLIGTLVIWKQTDFALNKDMGFSTDAIVHFPLPWLGSSNEKEQFARQIMQFPGITEVSRYNSLPARNGWNTSILEYEKDGQRHDLNVHRKYADTAYLTLFDLELLAGRPYRERDSTSEMVINETLAKIMGFSVPQDAIGSRIYNDDEFYPVVGVVRDFHVMNLHEPIPPLAMTYRTTGSIGVRIAASKWQDVDEFLAFASPKWNDIWPNQEFKYHFIDEVIARLYESEVRAAKLLTGGSLIAIIISFLGLLGLVTFLAFRRTKEIGIRKILGASMPHIVAILSWDFLKWICVAILPASVVGFVVMRRWLQDFAYTFDFSVLHIILAAFLSISVALFAVVTRGIRASSVDPVQSLRVE
ncbi:MAG: ABC transporter permease [Saprospiraceae bacterium]|nr:ABC transporter permease [Saprospiraceae bacterium]